MANNSGGPVTERITLKKEHFFTALFFALVVILFYLFYRIMAPFLAPIAWAAIFAIIFHPIYQWLGKRIPSPALRALILTITIVILIIAPAAYLGVTLVQESITMFNSFQGWVSAGHLDQVLNLENSPFYHMIQSRLAQYVDLSQLDPKVLIENGLKAISKVALSQTTQILANIGRVLFQFGLMVFFMFFLFRDGEQLFIRIRDIIPMAPDRANATIPHLKHVIERLAKCDIGFPGCIPE